MAIDCYTQALKLKPDNAVDLSNRAAAYFQTGDYRGISKGDRGVEHRLSVSSIACSWCFGLLWARLVSWLVCFVGVLV